MRRRGIAGELRELRQHSHGDPFKLIAWKATAKRGQLMVRDLETEIVSSVTVLVDGGAAAVARLGVEPDAGHEDVLQVQRTLDGAKILAERLMADDVKNNGISVLTGGTDVHLVMVDLRNSEMDGKQGEDLLAQCGITINRNTVPFDPRPASVASGLRIGTSALATRGFGPKEYEEVADIIGTALAAGQDADVDALKARVDKLAEDFPLYPGLDQIH